VRFAYCLKSLPSLTSEINKLYNVAKKRRNIIEI